MRILFDQGTPVPLRSFLVNHHVETAFERGWNTLKNGALLIAVEHESFEILLTTDRNLRYQQNLTGLTIAIIVLTTTSWPRIQKAIPEITHAIETATPGSIQEVNIPK